MIDLAGFIAISGYPGLFKVVAQTKNGVIVEGVADKKRLVAHSHFKISALEDISIYTTQEDTLLSNVFKSIFDKENGGQAISSKETPVEQGKYLESVLPNYDKERVHNSDIKKLFSWYNILQENNLLKVKEESNESDDKKPTVDLDKLKDTKSKSTTTVKKDSGPKPKTSTGGPAKRTATVRKTGA
ncbi:MAG: DUF5606 domain-containing protein [Bacteroidia bacterium]|jgi:hypothetical protein